MLWIVILLKLLNCFVEGDYVYSENGKCVVDGVNGTCVPVDACPEAVELLKRTEKSASPQICSFEGVATAVCCKEPVTTSTTARSSPRQGEESACHQKQRQTIEQMKTGIKAIDKCTYYNIKALYPCVFRVRRNEEWSPVDRCKLPGDSLIVGGGGRDADRYQFRHMVRLFDQWFPISGGVGTGACLKGCTR